MSECLLQHLHVPDYAHLLPHKIASGFPDLSQICPF
jgi:hypothetical protein